MTTGRPRMRIVVPAFPTFNVYTRVARKTTALGPVCIASSVADLGGWDVEVIDENNYRQGGPVDDQGLPDHAVLQQQRPAQIVGFYGGLTSTAPRLYNLAMAYRRMGVVTIAGGQHFVQETVPEALANGIDYVVIGEGEETVRELLTALKEGGDAEQVNGLVFLRNGRTVWTPSRAPLTDFDKLPLPDFSLLRYARITIYPVSRIRGCGMNCEFCAVKGAPRCARPERLLEQVAWLVETRDARRFFIVDDLFGQERAETLRLCRLLREYQQRASRTLDFTVQIRLDKATDTELLTAMRLAGINMLAIGYESPVPDELQAMKKHLRAEDMIKLSRTFRNAGFLMHGMFIFGYPMQDRDAFSAPATARVKAYERFIRRARLDTVQVLLPVPLPGTEFRDRLRNQGRLFPLAEFGWQYYDGNFPLFEPDAPLTAEDMQYAQRRIMGRFYRFGYMFLIGMHVLSFPLMIFFLRDLKLGWNRWYRPWFDYLHRFGGWLVMRRWAKDFVRSRFEEKLKRRASRAQPSAAGSFPGMRA